MTSIILRKSLIIFYTLLAFLTLTVPFYVLYKSFQSHIFKIGTYLTIPGSFDICYILFWLWLSFSCWITFNLLWKRRNVIMLKDTLTVLPLLSHFMRTMGDALGLLVGMIGFGFAFLTTLFFGNSGYGFSITSKGFFVSMDGTSPPANVITFISNGWVAVIVFPILGFLIFLFPRFLLQCIRMSFSIVTNTSRISNKQSNS